MATFRYKGLLRADAPIFNEPVTRWPTRLGRMTSGLRMISPDGSDGLPAEQPASESTAKPKDE
jgi:hypothetical protein